MKRIKEELFDYTNDGQNDYMRFNSDIHSNVQEKRKLLRNFFDATLDEGRLYYADKYSEYIFADIDMPEANYFRRWVLRREMSGYISYAKQRDHASHTLNNYLLGWYIYSQNDLVKQSLNNELGIKFPLDDPLICFGSIWPLVSLAHDVGYLFEGGIDNLTPEVQSQMVKCGMSALKDFFYHKFWGYISFFSKNKREILKNITDVKEPEFDDYSLAAVGDSLCFLNSLDEIKKLAITELNESQSNSPNILNEIDLPTYAFDLWKTYYQAYGKDNMINRIECLEKVHHNLIWEGSHYGVRCFDHGICSGLMLLLTSTYYYQFFSSLKNRYNHLDDINKNVADLFFVSADANYQASWWWSGIVWGTAATAIHNLQQYDKEWPGCENRPGKLSISEDPLAYLGILVDLLQEWDRYTIKRASVLQEEILPLQGKDVKLYIRNGIIRINYGDREHARSIKKNLENALEGWEDIVRIPS